LCVNDFSDNVFSNCSNDVKKELRSAIIELVLATDFSKHLEILGQFKSRKAAGELTNKREDRLLVLKMALKCADISHTAKTPVLHQNWTQRVTEEFYQQGEQEKKLGLPISSFMDRATGNIPKSQTGFISFLVVPLYEAFVQEFVESKLCFDQLNANLKYWQQLQQQTQQ